MRISGNRKLFKLLAMYNLSLPDRDYFFGCTWIESFYSGKLRCIRKDIGRI